MILPKTKEPIFLKFGISVNCYTRPGKSLSTYIVKNTIKSLGTKILACIGLDAYLFLKYQVI